MPTYDDFVFKESRIIGKAWADTNPSAVPQGLNESQLLQLFEKICEMSWRRLAPINGPDPNNGKSMWTILTEIGVNPADYIGENIIVQPGPIDKSKLIKFPRYGMSIAALLNASKCDIQETIKRFVDAGVQSTRINLITALFPDIDCLPFTQLPNGQWDLFAWNPQYFERLQEIKEGMNGNGIQIQWTNREIYSWSDRAKGTQQANTFWRNNVNGIIWGYSDSMFDFFPNDGFTPIWIPKVAPLLDLDINSFELGNEFPEKRVAEDDRDLVRSVVPNAFIQVNRNDDTPGQYTNMKIGREYDFIAFHGRKLKQLSDLTRKDGYEKEPDYKTFDEFIRKCPHDKWRVIFSSDGARISNDPTDTYAYIQLGNFFDHMIKLGYNIEHQSRAKMTPPPNHHMIEVDWFLKRIKK